MIHYDRIRLVVFDFDDTLCIHQFHGTRSSREYEHSMLQGKNYWSGHGAKPNVQMQEFIRMCQADGKEIGLISATESFVHMSMKQKWAEENYHVKFKNFCGGTWEKKIEILEDICEALDYDSREILIVDDMVQTLRLAEDAGFQACTPMAVVNLINEKTWRK